MFWKGHIRTYADENIGWSYVFDVFHRYCWGKISKQNIYLATRDIESSYTTTLLSSDCILVWQSIRLLIVRSWVQIPTVTFTLSLLSILSE